MRTLFAGNSGCPAGMKAMPSQFTGGNVVGGENVFGAKVPDRSGLRYVLYHFLASHEITASRPAPPNPRGRNRRLPTDGWTPSGSRVVILSGLMLPGLI